MWFCTPYAPGHQRDPLAPGASWGQVGADGGTHPSAGVLRHGAPAGSCCRQGARTNLGGTGGPKQPTEHAVEDAVTWLSCSPFRNGPGGGLALRRQGVGVRFWRGSRPSPARSVCSPQATLPKEHAELPPRRVCGGTGWLPCPGAAAPHPSSAHPSCQSPATAAPAACTSCQPCCGCFGEGKPPAAPHPPGKPLAEVHPACCYLPPAL